MNPEGYFSTAKKPESLVDIRYIGNMLDGVVGSLNDLGTNIEYARMEEDEANDDGPDHHTNLARILVESFSGDVQKARNFADELFESDSPEEVLKLLKNQLGDRVQWKAE